MQQANKVSRPETEVGTNLTLVGFRLSEDLLKRLEHAVVDRGGTRQQFIIDALESYLEVIEGPPLGDTAISENSRPSARPANKQRG